MRALPYGIASLVLQLYSFSCVLRGLDYHNSPPYAEWLMAGVAAIAGMALGVRWLIKLRNPTPADGVVDDSADTSAVTKTPYGGCLVVFNFALGLFIFPLFLTSVLTLFAVVTECPLLKVFFK